MMQPRLVPIPNLASCLDKELMWAIRRENINNIVDLHMSETGGLKVSRILENVPKLCFFELSIVEAKMRGRLWPQCLQR